MAGVPAEEMAATIAQERSRSYLPVVVKRRVDSVAVATIEEHRDALPGVSIRVEPLRRYVHGSLAAHLLGYVGEITEIEIQESASAAQTGTAPAGGPAKRTYQLGDVVGRAGIEQTFEARLGGRNGVRMVEVNALGRRVESLAPLTPFAGVKRPIPGEDLILTLDLELQRALEAALPDSLTGRGGGDRCADRGHSRRRQPAELRSQRLRDGPLRRRLEPSPFRSAPSVPQPIPALGLSSGIGVQGGDGGGGAHPPRGRSLGLPAGLRRGLPVREPFLPAAITCTAGSPSPTR